MTRTLPTLHEGHAPVHLHAAFEEALDAFEDWPVHADEPLVEFEGRNVPISSVFGRMRTCSDLLPQRVVLAVKHVVAKIGMSFGEGEVRYADAAILLRAICVDRLRSRVA